MAGISISRDRALNYFLRASSLLSLAAADPRGAAPSIAGAFRRRKGQTTVEYMLMLATVVAMTLIMGMLFHKKLLGGMFTMVGLVIGAGSSHH